MNNAADGEFAFTKLVVRDLARAAAFYRHVCGYGEGQWVKAAMLGRPIEEVIFRKPAAGLEMVLLTYLDGPASSCGDVVTAFDTSNLDEFEVRLLAAGGTIAEPIKVIEFGGKTMRIGFFTDLDGYVLEVMER